MKSFVIKIVLFFLAGILMFLCLTSLYRGEKALLREDHYLMAIIDKHKLLDSTPSPRIIIAGGSNAAFGMNSELLEKEFGIPVVNLALNATLGLPFMLGELRPNIKKGDIVFFSPEYYLGDGRFFLERLAERIPDIIQYSDYYSNTDKLLIPTLNALTDTKENILEKIKNPFLEKALVGNKFTTTNSEEIPIYSRRAFNKNGDVVAHYKEKSHLQKGMKRPIEYTYWEGIEQLNSFVKHLSKRNASAFYFFPPYAKSYYDQDAKPLDLHASDLKNDLNMDVLGEPKIFAYEDNLFFDTKYHLTKKGGNMRTMQWVKLLKQNKNFQLLLSQNRVNTAN